MAGRARKLEVVEPDVVADDETQAEQEEPATFDLEPINEEAQQVLRAWGNSTVICVEKLARLAPQWSELIGSFFELIKAEVRKQS